MPELKHTFTGGKMDKDNDERIVANGQYREALNIQVATSENSDVGAAQNILGNLKQTSAISGPNDKYIEDNYHIAHAIDPVSDNIYRFVHTPSENRGIWMDRIVEYNTEGGGDDNGRIFDYKYNEKAVAVDIFKVRTKLTGALHFSCDEELYLEFTGNVFQLRWGMQLTSVEAIGGQVEDTKAWGVYIQSIEIIDDGTSGAPASVRCKMNVHEDNLMIDSSTGQRRNDGLNSAIELSGFTNGDDVGSNFYFEGDRNLNFDSERSITGINIIDGMIFWTDNYSEPKKINIERAKEGSTYQVWDDFRDRRELDLITNFDYGDFDQHTRLVVNGENPTDCIIKNDPCAVMYSPASSVSGRTNVTNPPVNTNVTPVRGGGASTTNISYVCRPVYLEERHITVIRKGPTTSPSVEMYSYTQPDYNNDGLVDVIGEMRGITSTTMLNATTPLPDDPNVSGYNPDYPNGTNYTGISHLYYDAALTKKGKFNRNVSIFYDLNTGLLKQAGETVTLHINISSTGEDWAVNDILTIGGQYFNSFGVQQGCGITGVITDISKSHLFGIGVEIRITSISPSTPKQIGPNDIYTVRLQQKEPMFEYKFPRFSYRYKYEDGEYSIFAPWSEVAFIPEDFDYIPKKGYNLGMTNKVRSLELSDFVPKNIPKDVVQVDLLYKESNSPNIYTVESFKPDDPLPNDTALYNYWYAPGTGDNKGRYRVSSELIHAVVPSNQLLRPWDNVPRKALAQEITANRLIYANYLQNYSTIDSSGAPIKPIFSIDIDSIDITADPTNPDYENIGKPAKSLKTMRTYQLGVVYRDRYGRETPVLTSESGSVKIEKGKSFTFNKINVSLNNTANNESNYPDWAESFTLYVKETSNEYYNVAMDRWYNADDGNVWLSFPSSERNKINDDTVLILKKQHDSHIPVTEETRYKVVSIKNNAPNFIKTENQYWGSLAMMLPPPGWGTGGKPGGWQSGMFSPSGLPLPNRQYLDIYAEYWDQSVFSELDKKQTCQIRVVQAPGQTSAYVASGSDTTSFSEWYDVASISHMGQPPEIVEEESFEYDSQGNVIGSTTEEVELPATEIQLVRITLERTLGGELSFCQSGDNLDLSRGLMIEARTQIIKDKSQFQGRFFVKVERDAIIENSIIAPQTREETNWQVLQSRNIAYICAAHPGRQDWNHNIYIPFQGEDYTTFNATTNIQAGGASSVGDFDATPLQYGSGTVDHNDIRLISSYHENAKEAIAYAWNNVPTAPPGTASSTFVSSVFDRNNPGTKHFWPLGPGEQEFEAYFDPLNSTSWTPPIRGGGWLADSIAGNVLGISKKSRTISRETPKYWPSYFPSPWLPSFGDQQRDGASIGTFGLGQYDSGLPTPDPETDFIAPQGWTGINHLWKAAIWDRGDGDHGGNAWDWSLDTISRLGGAWFDLAKGRRMNTNWPLTVSWKRWFIDKAGSAQGYSGAGIWDHGNVSKMDVSFWGVGISNNYGYRSFELGTHQSEEVAFLNALGTTGTSFRFKQDPDQIVYTITNVKQTNVYNFEAPCGTWGYLDGLSVPYQSDDPATTEDESKELEYPGIHDDYGPNDGSLEGMDKRGAGCAKGLWPPYGPKKKHPGGMGGHDAFMSDFIMSEQSMTYGTQTYYTGASPYNRRVRLTLTLDKKIGSGPEGFHPITNHVGATNASGEQEGNILYHDGEANPADYDVTSTNLGYGSATESNGAIPDGKRFHNLNSYWNAADNAGGGVNSQPNTVKLSDANNFYSQNPDTYIGLHERGLNYTTIEIITSYSGDEGDRPMSNNPAIWETEPKEDVGLDIYQAASPTYPINLQRHRNDFDPEEGHFDYLDRGEEYIPVGSTCKIEGGSLITTVDGVSGNLIFLNSHIYEDPPGTAAEVPLLNSSGDPTKLIFKWDGEGKWYGAGKDEMFVEAKVYRTFDNNFKVIELQSNIHNERRSLSYFNCYSFANGVESNRVRDDYNAVTIDKGVKASMPLAEQYEEERKGSSLIFSGIYNSTSGVNRTNQFIQAEPITKDLNPINGSIQKLYTRDTDLVTFCENKVFKILAKKDALFNADGNTNVTSNAAVLGQSIPFSGEYGISKNPESFSAESFRVYFTDKTSGAVLRLSRDGITNISDYGMKDWFRDKLKFADKLVGSYDDKKDEYNLTIESYNTPEKDAVKLQNWAQSWWSGTPVFDVMSAYTISFSESRKGWVSFKSFIQEDGFSHKNDYYTFPSNTFNRLKNVPFKSALGYNYGDNIGNAEVWKHHQDIKIRALVPTRVDSSDEFTIQIGDFTDSASDYNIIPGMIVSGDGIPLETTVLIVDPPVLNASAGFWVQNIKLSNSVHLYALTEILFESTKNNFYGVNSFSSVTVMFNGDQGSVKRFKTLNYEGTQAEVTYKTDNIYYLHDANIDSILSGQGEPVGEVYYDNYQKDGWRVEELKTDLQEAQITEFIDKENKWYNDIRGFADAGDGDNIDTGEFSAQGLGRANIVDIESDIQGCMDPTATNYDETANLPCYGCCTYVVGCLDPTAINFNPNADKACDYNDCCEYTEGCMDPTALNYEPLALSDCNGDQQSTPPGNIGCCEYCVYGCTDPVATNYDGNATCNNGTCDYAWGCTDTTTVDGCGVGCDGALNQDCLTNNVDWSWPIANAGTNSSPGCGENPTVDDGSCEYCVYGCMDDGSGIITNPYNRPNGWCELTQAGAIINCPPATNYNANATCDDGTCIYETTGCTDSNADNYNPSATVDDGSCYILGCTDPNSVNYNPLATVDDNSCYTCNTGCMDPLAVNYDATNNCDCNGEPEFIGGNSNPNWQGKDWDSCCNTTRYGCMNPLAANYLNDNGDGGRDCNGSSYPQWIYPNTPCLTDDKPGGGTYGNTKPADYGCDLPDVTPDTYIRIIQDISGSMSPVSAPLKAAIIGDYGDTNCLRTDLQDIYANHPTWVQSYCIGNLGTSGCSDSGTCPHPSCDPKYNGKDAYETHVSHLVGWESPIAWAANIDPVHTHTLNMGQPVPVPTDLLIGGWWGATAPQAYNALTNLLASNAPDVPKFINSTGIWNGQLAYQQTQAPGLTQQAFPDAEKIFIITVGDEMFNHYQSTTDPSNYTSQMAKGGCNGDLNELGENNHHGFYLGGTEVRIDSPLGVFPPTYENSLYQFQGDLECGDLALTGTKHWTHLGDPHWNGSSMAGSPNWGMNPVTGSRHSGGVLSDLKLLQEQLTLNIKTPNLGAHPNIEYGAAFMTVETNGTDDNNTARMKVLLSCMVDGLRNDNACNAWGNFKLSNMSCIDNNGNPFNGHQSEGCLQHITSQRSLAEWNNWSNADGASIKFHVPDSISAKSTPAINQENLYLGIKSALSNLGVNIQ